tara:strand:+ start:36066 stop:36584 length:519 start_codon:yes stop_codon:yes gene_type:complete
MKKVLTFGASNSKTSINQQFSIYTANLVNSDYELIDLNNYELPIYSEDREKKNGIPDKAKDFFNKIGNSDIIIISFAEHNGTFTAAYKNIFDWMSRIEQGVFQGKDVIFLSTSIGEMGGSNVLSQAINSLPFFNGNLLFSYSLPSYYENFEKGKISNDKIRKDFEKKLKESI